MNSKGLKAGLSALALCVALGGMYQGVAMAGERSRRANRRRRA